MDFTTDLAKLPLYAAREATDLAPYAMFSIASAGREHPEPGHPDRGPFQRDRDRVVHSSAFRRLSGKTQVFTENMGDYHRTRLTHTMEVGSIARTIGRALRLNEDLIEALALVHDIGHPPFGHAGEDVLNACVADEGGFSHNAFALTLVRELERPYPHFPGLNLSREVLVGQLGRTPENRGQTGSLLEAQVVDAADSITYDAHDVDDAVKLGLLSLDRLREIELIDRCLRRVHQRFGHLEGGMLRRTLVHELIDIQVSNVIATSRRRLVDQRIASAEDAKRLATCVSVDNHLSLEKQELERFLYRHVYRHPQVVAGREFAQQRLKSLFDSLVADATRIPSRYRQRIERVGVRRAAVDYLAGMTDQYCLHQFQRLCEPSAAENTAIGD